MKVEPSTVQDISLTIESSIPCSIQPITVGIPFPKGQLQDPTRLRLRSDDGNDIPLQTETLALWPDQSAKWVLLDFVVQNNSALTLLESDSLAHHHVRETFHVLHGAKEDCSLPWQNTKYHFALTIPSGVVLDGWITPYGHNTGFTRYRLTVRNPSSARHQDGLWDIDDPASVTLPGIDLQVDAKNSITHAEKQLFISEQRDEPQVQIQMESQLLTIAIPEFWQNHPQNISLNNNQIQLTLLTGEMLQGGEQKTFTLWIHEGRVDESQSLPLSWVHRPARVKLPPEWYQQCGLFPQLPTSTTSRTMQLNTLLNHAIDGERSFAAKREIVNEYGWRDYGDVWADHEEEYYDGPKPIISHYNNQYDVIYGAMLQYFRTGDERWLDIYDPLARHVYDIDIYHTTEDKSAYNGGLFWHTDHYKDAATSTHRCYSKANVTPGQPYGGGPSNEHNYTTGLLHYYYLTGDHLARDAVLSLANWVLNMDDGSKTIFGIVDDDPTGLASATRHDDYHGPGRGAGNSINALLDGWLLTTERHYLDYAETLIRRCIHPKDDIAARDLLNVEDRWSYTVFLTTLSRYLDLKIEYDELDEQYAYGRASLLHYAEWMAEHEVFYFDHPEKMEYPTSTWAAQEIRKANVLRLTARFAESPLRERFIERGEEFAERVWQDLLRFETRTTTRPLAIMMTEGLRDLRLQETLEVMPKPTTETDFGEPQDFVPQKQRVKSMIQSPMGAIRAGLRLMHPGRWLRYWKRNRQ